MRHPIRSTTAALAAVAAAASTVAVAAGPSVAAPHATEPSSQRSAIEVTVRVADGEPRTVMTKAVHPVAVLNVAGIKQTPYDRVLLVRAGRIVPDDRERTVRADDTLRVVRIDRHETVRHHKIARGTVVHKTTKLKPGVRKVVSKGRPGVRAATIVRWTRNGERFDTDVTRTVVRAPKPRRVLLGVKSSAVPGTGGLNWAALARCESGGNPRAVNPAGYYGLYQFSVGTWHSVGGSGMPNQASAAEQTHRAQILYSRSGRSPWPYCGRFL